MHNLNKVQKVGKSNSKDKNQKEKGIQQLDKDLTLLSRFLFSFMHVTPWKVHVLNPFLGPFIAFLYIFFSKLAILGGIIVVLNRHSRLLLRDRRLLTCERCFSRLWKICQSFSSFKPFLLNITHIALSPNNGLSWTWQKFGKLKSYMFPSRHAWSFFEKPKYSLQLYNNYKQDCLDHKGINK